MDFVTNCIALSICSESDILVGFTKNVAEQVAGADR